MKTGPLFDKLYNCRTKYVINQGGTSSGKTYTIMQLLAILAIQKKNRVITVAGATIPMLKRGAMRDFSRILADDPAIASMIDKFNATDRYYIFNNGSVIEFNSYIDEQAARAGKRDILFVNECNGIPFDIFFQLAIRTKKRVFLDYNPSARFWVHDKLLGKPGATRFITDHRHNPFLPEELHNEIESIEDKEAFKVYARGMTGKIAGTIYPNYATTDALPDFLPICYGLDFGYSNPTALVRVCEWTDEKALYWEEVIYRSHLLVEELIELMKEKKIPTDAPIFCDSASPDKIEILRTAGFNALKADKAVIEGIQYCQFRKIFITEDSENLLKEIDRYVWSSDDADEVRPVKLLDHALDAARYASYTNRNNYKKATVLNGGLY